MPQREPIAISAAMPSSFEPSGWGPGSDDAAVESTDGPGLLVSPRFWLGGAVSIGLWACATLLALQWL
jgi:hypothetical protein